MTRVVVVVRRRAESASMANQSPVYILTRDFVTVWLKRAKRVFVDWLGRA